MATNASTGRRPNIDRECVSVEHESGMDVHNQLGSGAECFVPPVDEDMWVAYVADEIAIGAKDAQHLETLVESFFDTER